MKRSTFLAASAVLVLTAGNATAQPGLRVSVGTANIGPIRSGEKILYSQNSGDGYSVISQNFTSGSFGTSYNSAAADDFVIPGGKTWKVAEVDVTGSYFYLSGPARSEVITFYKSKNGRPGTIVGQPQTLECTDTAGSFACSIRPVNLRGGANGRRYWISVVANCSYVSCGEWGWIQNTSTHRDPGQWENPGGGLNLGCTTWSDTSSCNLQTGGADDFAFALRGKSE